MLQIVFQARLRTHTPEAYALISNMMFTQEEYEDLLRLYNSIDDKENNSGKVYEEVTTTITSFLRFKLMTVSAVMRQFYGFLYIILKLTEIVTIFQYFSSTSPNVQERKQHRNFPTAVYIVS